MGSILGSVGSTSSTIKLLSKTEPENSIYKDLYIKKTDLDFKRYFYRKELSIYWLGS